jgi:hypothetical protein
MKIASHQPNLSSVKLFRAIRLFKFHKQPATRSQARLSAFQCSSTPTAIHAFAEKS